MPYILNVLCVSLSSYLAGKFYKYKFVFAANLIAAIWNIVVLVNYLSKAKP